MATTGSRIIYVNNKANLWKKNELLSVSTRFSVIGLHLRQVINNINLAYYISGQFQVFKFIQQGFQIIYLDLTLKP